MKLAIRNHFLSAILLLFTQILFAQDDPPVLGDAASFAVFTADGAFNVTGEGTTVTGDVGTNIGAFNGFPPGTLIGTKYLPGSIKAANAATDVIAAYMYLDGLTAGPILTTPLGGGQILTPDTYTLTTASVLGGNLTLSGDGIFIFQIDGAFSTNPNSSVTLTNGALACNVFWQVNGAVNLGTSTAFQGIILAEGAISFFFGASLNGQALSTAGAISISTNNIGLPCTYIISGASNDDLNGTWVRVYTGDDCPCYQKLDGEDFEGDFFTIEAGTSTTWILQYRDGPTCFDNIIFNDVVPQQAPFADRPEDDCDIANAFNFEDDDLMISTPPPPAPVFPIPTLSQWAIIILGLCLFIIGLVAVRQKHYKMA